MRPMLQHASRSLLEFAGALARSTPRRFALDSASSPASVCLRCQFRVSARQQKSRTQLAINGSPSLATRRLLSTSRRLLQDPPKPSNPALDKLAPKSESPTPLPTPPPPPIPPKSEDTIARVSDKDLPSHREGQRWSLSKRFSELMDELLPKLAVVTQKVNNYTGTDYSGIEALRREIREQEELVKSRRLLVEEAKQALDAALSQQTAAQKEIVRLLERKNSWLDSELERYMSLIRSEHVNEQAVSAAKDRVLAAELSLEEARSHLEKRERAQYHEEQIWSDTIRRNSTWVTFGLMGVNIFLLLASLIIIDPWRRRRLVREIRRTLDEQKSVPAPVLAPTATQSMEDAIDFVVEPAGVTLESLGDADTSAQSLPTTPTIETITPPEAVMAAAEDSASREIPESPAGGLVEASAEAPLLTPQQNTGETPLLTQSSPDTWQQRLTDVIQQYREHFLDLFSERPISMRRVDLTSATLEGVAAGAVLMSLLLLLVRPK